MSRAIPKGMKPCNYPAICNRQYHRPNTPCVGEQKMKGGKKAGAAPKQVRPSASFGDGVEGQPLSYEQVDHYRDVAMQMLRKAKKSSTDKFYDDKLVTKRFPEKNPYAGEEVYAEDTANHIIERYRYTPFENVEGGLEAEKTLRDVEESLMSTLPPVRQKAITRYKAKQSMHSMVKNARALGAFVASKDDTSIETANVIEEKYRNLVSSPGVVGETDHNSVQDFVESYNDFVSALPKDVDGTYDGDEGWMDRNIAINNTMRRTLQDTLEHPDRLAPFDQN